MFFLHRQRSGETDFERLAFGLIVVAVAGAAAWMHFGLRAPPCPFRTLTGIPCLTCGGTRCVRNLFEGHFATAFGWNPLVFLGVAGLLGYACYAAIVTVLNLPRIRLGAFSPVDIQVLRVTTAVALAANWIYLIFRFSNAP